MGSAILALAPIYITVGILMAGNGLVTTLVPLRGTVEGFAAQSIGLIGASYFVGMLAGTWATPAIVRHAGHIRAFAAYAAVAGTLTLGYAVLVHPVAWFLFRMLIGFCFAGLITILDGWINFKATNSTRGSLLAFSNAVNFTGGAAGQQILRAADARSFSLFSAGAAMLILSLLPMALTRAEPPPPPPKGRIDVAGLLRTSPIGVVCMVLIGLCNGAFWSLVPAYVERQGMGMGDVSSFMTAMIVGSALGPYPIGRIADVFDRRVVIVAVSLLAALIEATIAATMPHGALLFALAFLLGLCLPVIYPLVSAHTNDRVGREGVLTISSTLLFLYCVGGIIGPVVVSALMAGFGDSWLFVWTMLMHIAIAAFVLQRMLVRAAPPEKVVSAAVPASERPNGLS